MRFVARLAPPIPLICPADADDDIRKTVLILIQNMSPRRVRALYKIYHDDLSDDEVLRRFDVAIGWNRFPRRNGRRTRLDLNLHDNHSGDARVFFRVEAPDLFMEDENGDATYALSGTSQVSLNQLYCSRWVDSGTGERDTACMIVKAGADTHFNLGVVIQDNDDVEVVSPIFFDPKIENNG